jgi:hypothetical protein
MPCTRFTTRRRLVPGHAQVLGLARREPPPWAEVERAALVLQAHARPAAEARSTTSGRRSPPRAPSPPSVPRLPRSHSKMRPASLPPSTLLASQASTAAGARDRVRRLASDGDGACLSSGLSPTLLDAAGLGVRARSTDTGKRGRLHDRPRFDALAVRVRRRRRTARGSPTPLMRRGRRPCPAWRLLVDLEGAARRAVQAALARHAREPAQRSGIGVGDCATSAGALAKQE